MGSDRSLTDPPNNLKEAIDWMVRISFLDKSRNLKNAVEKLENFTQATQGLGNFTVEGVEGLFNYVAKALKTLIGYNTGGGEALTGNGIGRKDHSPYTSSYSDSAKWDGNLNTPGSEGAKKVALIFLCYVPILYLGVTYLFWQCSNTQSHVGWKSLQLRSSSSALYLFMSSMGFDMQALQDKSGSDIAKLMEDQLNGFDDFKNVSKAEYSYSSFLQKLEQKHGRDKLNANAINSPLHSLYLASTAYVKYRFNGGEGVDATFVEIRGKLQTFKASFNSDPDLKDEIDNFISTCMTTPRKPEAPSQPSPAGPAAGGLVGVGALGAGVAYGLNLAHTVASLIRLIRGKLPFLQLRYNVLISPSNLKEAIDWILRVTGKDGHTAAGDGGTKALSEKVKELLSDVENSGTELGKEIQKVMSALNNGDIITKLAEGLQQFIGYKSESNTTGQITGAGIAPSNMATHRLCDAAIAFTIGVLDSLKITKGVRGLTSDFKGKINKVVSSLHAKYGSGTNGLKEAANSVNEIGNDKLSGSNVNAFVKEMAAAFETNLQNISSDSVDTVASKVGEYLKGVLKSWVTDNATGVNAALHNIGNALQSHKYPYKPNGDDVKYAIGNVNSAIKTELRSFGNTNISYLKPILDAGKKAFMDALKMPNYTRMNYNAQSVEWNRETAKVQTCAKIFLGCLPLYYQALTYIYWGCHEKGGGWGSQTLANGSMRSYFDSQGLLPTFVDRSKRGAHIAETALGGFSEFTKGMSGASSSSTFPYASFAAELRKKVGQNSGQLADSCPLSALFYGASCYFRCQQITTANIGVRAPKTIREMLYFLAALQFSSAYDEVEGHIGTVLKDKLNVADSSQKGGDNKLSAENMKEYLRASCAFSSSVLGLIQGPGASQNASDPWLFELFCNSAFQFKYPSSSSTLFNTLSSYAYALQFQLLFLYSMCANNVNKCGWQHCTYGKEINASGISVLQSHICPGLKCNGDSSCKHDGTTSNNRDCKHNNYSQSEGCGKSASTPSPLQAFITGALPSFGLSTSTTPNHMSDHPQGALCHTPMGFQATHLRQDQGTGNYIYSAFYSFCGTSSSPLRQLCEKLGCLTKRTPRSLGDLFGFTWHLNGQLYNKRTSNPATHNWVTKLANLTPFSSTVKDHLDVLKTFVGSSQSHSSEHNAADLTSLHSSGCKNQGNTCGPYLFPLTLSNGATFGKPAPYASTYLSWMVYLTDDLQSGFQELLDEFKNIDCSKTGCRKPATGGQQCQQRHATGDHGISTNCTCDSVVHCGGVLPLLYRYGFTFSDMGALFGEGRNSGTKRNCNAFHTQLQSVITGKPLQDLFESIDYFLFLFRYYFLSNLSGFWTTYMCLILYTFFFLLDTLHLRSHLKLTASPIVPPLALLTSGKPLPITKLTYIGQ
ncbi:uncharacterized protein BcabD6B2_29300 [Babesia caballi]|uniref:Uncharacterized protein n=1 Tax=Babesia caballi TaxID=5871 RepID=A0AAV4LV76_BABCB|nr:hypothetical protein, conserved [Babesia caballi]